MLKIENAFLIDICLGFPMGKMWFPSSLPETLPEEEPATYLLNGQHLAALRKLAQSEDSSVMRAVEAVCDRADTFLEMPNPSVMSTPHRTGSDTPLIRPIPTPTSQTTAAASDVATTAASPVTRSTVAPNKGTNPRRTTRSMRSA